jgi:RND family efflux transporter MFP subunit
MSAVKRRAAHVLITVMLVAAGALGFKALSGTRQELKRQQPAAFLPGVRVVPASPAAGPVVIRGEGTVAPLREVDLVPQVGGEVVYVSPSLVDGGGFEAGELLVRIDPEDYRLAVTLARAKVEDAQSKLETLQAESAAALEEWRFHRRDKGAGGGEPPPLLVKEPQLQAAKAQLAAQRAELRRAELSLERTEIHAPFNGRVSRESVDKGQVVAAGRSLATLYGTDAAEVVVPLQPEDLAWFDIPGFTNGEGPGAEAVVRGRIAGEERTWQGRVLRSEGRLDEKTRMLGVVVGVEDPYGTRPPLAVGLFVRVGIMGTPLENAVRIPRAALRQGDVVWVVEDGRLRFRPVTVARTQGEEALVTSGLEEGDLVTVSRLEEATDGMAVRTILEPREGTS